MKFRSQLENELNEKKKAEKKCLSKDKKYMSA